METVWIDERFVLLSARGMKAAERQVDCLMICLIVNQYNKIQCFENVLCEGLLIQILFMLCGVSFK